MITDLEILELFNKRAARIQGLQRFIESLNSKRSVSVKFNENGIEVTKLEPDEESLSAAILTLRMFIQNNEPISFEKMSSLYLRINVPQELKDDFNTLRNELNNYLDATAPISIGGREMIFGKPPVDSQQNSEHITNRELMEIYIYGDYSHSNEEKRKAFERIASNPLFAPIGSFLFANIIETITSFVQHTTRLNQEAIQYLRKNLE